MAAAQILAARIAGVDELVYHSLDDDALAAFRRGHAIADGIAEKSTLGEAALALHALEFTWGTSDGN